MGLAGGMVRVGICLEGVMVGGIEMKLEVGGLQV